MMNEETLHRGQRWLENLLVLAKLPASVEADDSMYETEGSCWLTIDVEVLSPEQIQTLIGSKGEVLDAIQYLANTTLNLGQPEAQQSAYTIELNNYRRQRQAELQAIAEESAQKVLETGEEVEIAALSSAERRQVHTLLKSYETLETYSKGKEPDRRLVIRRLEA